MTDNVIMPTVFLPHGAGPCFFMDWQPAHTWQRMETWLRGLIDRLGSHPKAVVVISAHWEAPRFTVNTQARPGLLFDYYGFPDQTYRLTWPASGDPDLAGRVGQLVAVAGLAVEEDRQRDLDHGVFIPLKLVFPEADVPVVQLSLREGLDPAEHLALGRALAPLRHEGVLIIGSGMTSHNMPRLVRGGPGLDPDSRRFNDWLAETVALPRDEREQRLTAWERAPGGRASHPREEHLLPLHVVAGAAGEDPGRQDFEDQVIGSIQCAFVFGKQAA